MRYLGYLTQAVLMGVFVYAFCQAWLEAADAWKQRHRKAIRPIHVSNAWRWKE